MKACQLSLGILQLQRLRQEDVAQAMGALKKKTQAVGIVQISKIGLKGNTGISADSISQLTCDQRHLKYCGVHFGFHSE